MLRRELVDNKFLISELWETERMIIRAANLHDVDRLQEIYMQSKSTEGWACPPRMVIDEASNGTCANGPRNFLRTCTNGQKN